MTSEDDQKYGQNMTENDHNDEHYFFNLTEKCSEQRTLFFEFDRNS